MPSAISVTSVSMGRVLSERERVFEDAGAGSATGEDLHELDGVDLDPLAVRALAELSTRGPLGHETTVVVGGEVHPAPGRGAQVDAVGPHVTREPDVEQVPEPHPTDGRPE